MIFSFLLNQNTTQMKAYQIRWYFQLLISKNYFSHDHRKAPGTPKSTKYLQNVAFVKPWGAFGRIGRSSRNFFLNNKLCILVPKTFWNPCFRQNIPKISMNSYLLEDVAFWRILPFFLSVKIEKLKKYWKYGSQMFFWWPK